METIKERGQTILRFITSLVLYIQGLEGRSYRFFRAGKPTNPSLTRSTEFESIVNKGVRRHATPSSNNGYPAGRGLMQGSLNVPSMHVMTKGVAPTSQRIDWRLIGTISRRHGNRCLI